MQIAWRNGVLTLGPDFLRGPRTRSLVLAWNPLRDPPLGCYRHADHVQLLWQWPRFRGFTLRRYKAPWRENE